MAKDKEKSINPAQQQRKLEKAKALKKSRAELQVRRNEKLARRNPDRIQREIDDLKALESSGDIKAREKAILEELERDLRSIRKAREALGEKAPQFGSGPGRQDNRRLGDNKNQNNILGKRGYDGERKHSQFQRDLSGSDTDESVRRIPMPEDTPPPLPREYRRNNYQNRDMNTNQNQDQSQSQTQAQPVAKTTYSSEAQLRDLKKESTSKFIPNVVRRKQDAVKGKGGTGSLIEPEELDRLEAQGYGSSNGVKLDNSKAFSKLDEEEERFIRELEMENKNGNKDGIEPQEKRSQNRRVQIEEVEDEDG